MKQAEESIDRRGPGRRACACCGEQILDPDDYFTAGYLTSVPSHPRHRFNYVQLHRSHLPEWKDHAEFRRLMEEFQASEEWDAPGFSPFE